MTLLLLFAVVVAVVVVVLSLCPDVTYEDGWALKTTELLTYLLSYTQFSSSPPFSCSADDK